MPSSFSPSTASPSYYPSLSPSVVFIISTIAGTGTVGYGGDEGDATSAILRYPYCIALDSAGRITKYFIDPVVIVFLIVC